MALYPTVPVCIQLTDYELETPHLGVAPVYRTVLPLAPPPPYNPSLYPSLEGLDPPAHCLPQYVALVGLHPLMALYPTVPVCIQLTDYELETPHLGVAPVYRTVLPLAPPPPYNPSLYPSLEGLDPPAHCLPQYVALVGLHPLHQAPDSLSNKALPQAPEHQESKMITKEIILNKKDGKFGIKTAVLGKSVIVYRVSKGSPAAWAGLQLGDQLIRINGIEVTGLTNDAVHDIIRRCPQYGIKFTIRSRKDYALFKKLESVKNLSIKV